MFDEHGQQSRHARVALVEMLVHSPRAASWQNLAEMPEAGVSLNQGEPSGVQPRVPSCEVNFDQPCNSGHSKVASWHEGPSEGSGA